MKDKFKIKEGREKGNNRNITTSRPTVQAAPQPQICYKSGEACKYNCPGLCKDSY